MKSLATFVVLLGVAWAQQPLQRCNADNCLRAVRATNIPTETQALQTSQCKSFLSFTVQPTATTLTTTITSYTAFGNDYNTESYTPGAPYQPGTVNTISGTYVPPYAQTACPATPSDASSSRYSSACLCAGVTPQTTTLASGTVYTKVTQTATVSAFQVRATSNGGGGYIVKNEVNSTTIFAGVSARNTGALVFRLYFGYLQALNNGLNQYRLQQQAGRTFFPVEFRVTQNPAYDITKVAILPDGTLQGILNGNNAFWNICAGNLELGTQSGGLDQEGRQCDGATLSVIPVAGP